MTFQKFRTKVSYYENQTQKVFRKAPTNNQVDITYSRNISLRQNLTADMIKYSGNNRQVTLMENLEVMHPPIDVDE